MNEKISVLMPVYNREKFVVRAIESILTQTYKNIQVIVYDDGSTDDTWAELLKLTQKDNRIKLYGGIKNVGVAKARNILLDLCDTKYAIWQDSDDVSHPKRIEKQLEAMTQDQMVYVGWDNLKSKKIGNNRAYASVMFPVDKSIRFPKDTNFGAEDAIWHDRMNKKYASVDIPEILYSIDFHNNRIGTWKRKILKEWGGVFSEEEIKGLSYEEGIRKYKNMQNM